MAGLLRLTSVWTGFAGAPGYTNFYGHHNGVSAQDVADQFADDVKDFWDALNSYIPNDVTVTIDSTWSSIDPATGNILAQGSVAAPPGATVGLTDAAYPGNAGAAIDWHTDTFIAGRRLKGRTYLVPLASAFGANGRLYSIARQAIIDAATALWGGSTNMVVWHRPVGGAGGSYSQITSATVTDRAAILRSRSV